MKVYFDNTATTPLDPKVMEVMVDTMKNNFGNPSAVHNYGRIARSSIEKARRLVADNLNASPSEIFFTSGGTESNNTVIHGCVYDLGVTNVITSPIEHHSILHTLDVYQKQGLIKLKFVKLNELGQVDLIHLQELLEQTTNCLVTLMHANNEISNLLPIKEVSKLCRKYNAYFHSDTVQTMGHYKIDFQAIDVDFASCSAHKFHGPKGAGFLYINGNTVKIKPLIYGGGQERDMRGGTENIIGILGLTKAFEIANENMEFDQQKIIEIKQYMVAKLISNFENINFLGDSKDKGLYTVLSTQFPAMGSSEMLLMNLDIEGVCVSSGSACASGTNIRSHVLEAINSEIDKPVIRFSFSRFNTCQEVDYCIDVLKKHILV